MTAQDVDAALAELGTALQKWGPTLRLIGANPHPYDAQLAYVKIAAHVETLRDRVAMLRCVGRPRRPMTDLTRDWTDIGFSARLTEKGSHLAEFAIYSQDCRYPVMYHRRGATSWPDPVESIEDAEVYAHGTVKWDGCSNWQIDEAERICLHGCSREDLLALGEAMARCWDWAGEVLDTWDQ